ncbi:MAG TPA: IS1595 family transposase [Stellaceae bacterium]|nr:IS1595 family transposase [Stellaceae bacterium]
MTVNLTDPIFTDEAKALAYFEAARWPDGVFCPHCGNDNATRIYAITANVEHGVREGLRECQDCHGQFTVRTGGIMESSHLPLTKWALAYRLMASAKKGISAHQLGRTIGVSYKTAWFLCHRIRESMRDTDTSPLGSGGGTVEVDETYVGGKPRPRSGKSGGTGRGTKKVPVVALVERYGRARAHVVSDVTAKTLRETMKKNIDKGARLMTDDFAPYRWIGGEFERGHGIVHHGRHEYAQGDTHSNTVESFFALLKRGVYGSFHHVSKEHLDRYCDEFAFRWSNRGMDDTERTLEAIKGGDGKRLTYRPAHTATSPEA